MKEEDNHARCTKLFKIFFPEVLFPFIPFRSNGSPFGNSTIQFSCVLGTFEGKFRTICQMGNTGSVGENTGSLFERLELVCVKGVGSGGKWVTHGGGEQ